MYFEIYKDRVGEWRWRLKVTNGNIIADSGEGYKTRKDCDAMCCKIIDDAWRARIKFIK